MEKEKVDWTVDDCQAFIRGIEEQCASTQQQINHPNFGNSEISKAFFQGQIAGKKYVADKLKDLIP